MQLVIIPSMLAAALYMDTSGKERERIEVLMTTIESDYSLRLRVTAVVELRSLLPEMDNNQKKVLGNRLVKQFPGQADYLSLEIATMVGEISLPEVSMRMKPFKNTFESFTKDPLILALDTAIENCKNGKKVDDKGKVASEIERLLKIVANPANSSRLKVLAVEQIVQMRNPAVVERLARLLMNGVPGGDHFTVALIEALHEFGDKKALPYLEKCKERRLHGKIYVLLEPAIKECKKTRKVSKSAEALLGIAFSKEAGTSARTDAITKLARLDEPQVAIRLLPLLAADHLAVVLATVETLGRFADRHALQALTILKDSQVNLYQSLHGKIMEILADKRKIEHKR